MGDGLWAVCVQKRTKLGGLWVMGTPGNEMGKLFSLSVNHFDG